MRIVFRMSILCLALLSACASSSPSGSETAPAAVPTQFTIPVPPASPAAMAKKFWSERDCPQYPLASQSCPGYAEAIRRHCADSIRAAIGTLPAGAWNQVCSCLQVAVGPPEPVTKQVAETSSTAIDPYGASRTLLCNYSATTGYLYPRRYGDPSADSDCLARIAKTCPAITSVSPH